MLCSPELFNALARLRTESDKRRALEPSVEQGPELQFVTPNKELRLVQRSFLALELGLSLVLAPPMVTIVRLEQGRDRDAQEAPSLNNGERGAVNAVSIRNPYATHLSI